MAPDSSHDPPRETYEKIGKQIGRSAATVLGLVRQATEQLQTLLGGYERT